MKAFVATLALIAILNQNVVSGMTTSCPVVVPSDFCTLEIQPYHCGNSLDYACSASENCCKDGCGKYRCTSTKPVVPEILADPVENAACPAVTPSDFCTMEIQPFHCANSAELACPTDSTCCKDGCGKFNCLPKAKKTSLRPGTFPRNPIGCPAFDPRPMCTRDIQLYHCANSAEHACTVGNVCCRDFCGKHHCYASNVPQIIPLNTAATIKSAIAQNPVGCPKIPLAYQPFCTLEIQEEHCANNKALACSANENCCANVCGKFYCQPNVEVQVSEEEFINPASCPAFPLNPMCTMDIQTDHCANNAAFACPANQACCKNTCGKFHCY